MPARRAAVAVLLALSAACGNSREEKAVDEIQAQCEAFVSEGATLTEAGVAMRGAEVGKNPRCDTNLGPLPSNDVCAPVDGDARCETFWFFYAASLCSPVGGCCQICEVRVVESDLSKNGGDAVVCGSRFYRRQPCPF